MMITMMNMIFFSPPTSEDDSYLIEFDDPLCSLDDKSLERQFATRMGSYTPMRYTEMQAVCIRFSLFS